MIVARQSTGSRFSERHLARESIRMALKNKCSVCFVG
jgi:hypothetical protein